MLRSLTNIIASESDKIENILKENDANNKLMTWNEIGQSLESLIITSDNSLVKPEQMDLNNLKELFKNNLQFQKILKTGKRPNSKLQEYSVNNSNSELQHSSEIFTDLFNVKEENQNFLKKLTNASLNEEKCSGDFEKLLLSLNKIQRKYGNVEKMPAEEREKFENFIREIDIFSYTHEYQNFDEEENIKCYVDNLYEAFSAILE